MSFDLKSTLNAVSVDDYNAVVCSFKGISPEPLTLDLKQASEIIMQLGDDLFSSELKDPVGFEALLTFADLESGGKTLEGQRSGNDQIQLVSAICHRHMLIAHDEGRNINDKEKTEIQEAFANLQKIYENCPSHTLKARISVIQQVVPLFTLVSKVFAQQIISFYNPMQLKLDAMHADKRFVTAINYFREKLFSDSFCTKKGFAELQSAPSQQDLTGLTLAECFSVVSKSILGIAYRVKLENRDINEEELDAIKDLLRGLQGMMSVFRKAYRQNEEISLKTEQTKTLQEKVRIFPNNQKRELAERCAKINDLNTSLWKLTRNLELRQDFTDLKAVIPELKNAVADLAAYRKESDSCKAKIESQLNSSRKSVAKAKVNWEKMKAEHFGSGAGVTDTYVQPRISKKFSILCKNPKMVADLAIAFVGYAEQRVNRQPDEVSSFWSFLNWS